MVMKFHWPTDIKEAMVIQETLKSSVQLYDDFTKIDYIAGVDCSYDIKNNLCFAVLIWIFIERQLKSHKPISITVTGCSLK